MQNEQPQPWIEATSDPAMAKPLAFAFCILNNPLNPATAPINSSGAFQFVIKQA
jgi:hypothetical protein